MLVGSNSLQGQYIHQMMIFRMRGLTSGCRSGAEVVTSLFTGSSQPQMFSWLINNVSALKPADLPVDPLTWPSSSSCSTTDEIHCDSLTLNVCLNTSCYYRKITPFIAHTPRQTYYYSKVGFVWAPTWCDHMINVFVHICSILDTIALSTEYLWNSGVF